MINRSLVGELRVGKMRVGEIRQSPPMSMQQQRIMGHCGTLTPQDTLLDEQGNMTHLSAGTA